MADAPRPGNPGDPGEAFAKEAETKAPSLARELFDFLRHNKKWWLLPILVVLLVVGVLVVLGGTVLGPFLYPLF